MHQNQMNQDLLRAHVQRLSAQGMCPEDIGERCGMSGSHIGHMIVRPAGPVHCDRCGTELSFYSAIRISSIDFCKGCRAALFADPAMAAEQYPELFCEEDP